MGGWSAEQRCWLYKKGGRRCARLTGIRGRKGLETGPAGSHLAGCDTEKGVKIRDRGGKPPFSAGNGRSEERKWPAAGQEKYRKRIQKRFRRLFRSAGLARLPGYNEIITRRAGGRWKRGKPCGDTLRTVGNPENLSPSFLAPLKGKAAGRRLWRRMPRWRRSWQCRSAMPLSFPGQAGWYSDQRCFSRLDLEGPPWDSLARTGVPLV